MKSTAADSTHKRLVRLQRHIHNTIKAEVRKALGSQSAAIRRYYEAYKREFRGPVRHSSKEELLKDCVRAHIVLVGDYHTFSQSQKAALRLLRELVNWDTPITLALEMVPSAHQKTLDGLLSGRLGEEEFLRRVDYPRSWGFPWPHFRPLLVFAKEHKLPVLALNVDSPHLEARDAHAASILAAYAKKHPARKIFAIYGDLHIARGHIPKYLKRRFTEENLRRRLLTVFQNSESLYWKLATQKMEHTIDVLRLGRGRYCIMNAAPWVKLQSYLQWAEAATETGEAPELTAGSRATLQDVPLQEIPLHDVPLHEMAHDCLRNLAELLGIPLPSGVDFTIQTVHDLAFLESARSRAELTRVERKIVKYHVIGNRTLYIRDHHTLYLPSTGINSLCEGVARLLHAMVSRSRTLFHDPSEHFFAAALAAAVAYFGSKVLNHKRKCDLEEDFRLLLERPLTSRALPRERLQRKVARAVLSHCRANRAFLRDGEYRAPRSATGPSQTSVFLETALALGAILGERLYAAFVEGKFPADKIRALFKANLDSPKAARRLYLGLLTDLKDVTLAHASKQSLL
ncbi:MAG: ChaN family lipoprotein [Deltaproteobacteria bacterium]|nr:ChaN family lipoprotein [Deltaproteobacteria bacterium]